MRRGVSAAFTLIELLVVIAIIALLLGLLAPALSRARESSRRAACANQLRQVGIAVGMYANDRNEFLPGVGFYGVTPVYNRDPRNVINSLLRYLDLPASTTWSTAIKDNNYAKVFACPSYKGAYGGKCYRLPDQVVADDGTTVLKPWGFMYTATGLMSPPSLRITSVPASAIALRDDEGGVSEPNHRTDRNALFYDFHVGRVDMNNQPL